MIPRTRRAGRGDGSDGTEKSDISVGAAHQAHGRVLYRRHYGCESAGGLRKIRVHRRILQTLCQRRFKSILAHLRRAYAVGAE